MPEDTLDIILVFAVLLIVIFIFIRIAVKIRRGGGSMTTLMYGATDEFYNKDKKKAIEYIAEQKANKKMTEQTPGEGKKPQ
jgi:hypothetical protein